jgi:hypothetical protein
MFGRGASQYVRQGPRRRLRSFATCLSAGCANLLMLNSMTAMGSSLEPFMRPFLDPVRTSLGNSPRSRLALGSPFRHG